VHVLVDEAGGFTLLLLNKIAKLDYVWPSVESLQNLNFTIDLFSLDRLQYLDHGLLVVRCAITQKDFAVLASSKLVKTLIVFDIAPSDLHGTVIAIILRSIGTDWPILSAPLLICFCRLLHYH